MAHMYIAILPYGPLSVSAVSSFITICFYYLDVVHVPDMSLFADITLQTMLTSPDLPISLISHQQAPVGQSNFVWNRNHTFKQDGAPLEHWLMSVTQLGGPQGRAHVCPVYLFLDYLNNEQENGAIEDSTEGMRYWPQPWLTPIYTNTYAVTWNTS